MTRNKTCQGNSQMVPIEAILSFLKQSKLNQLGFFSGSVSVVKHMTVSHLDSSKSERCAVKFPKMFLTRYKKKNLILQIKLL